MSYTEELADFFGKLSYEMLPPEVIHQAKIVLLDFMGICIGAGVMPEAHQLNNMVKAWGDKEEASVLGMGFKTSVRSAAFGNGILSTLLELQDGLQFRGIHISEAVPPAVLALGEWKKVDGKKFIASLVTGYEVAGRLAEAVFPSHLKRGYMPSGTVGAFGAAAGAAKILDLGNTGIRESLGIMARIVPMSIEYEDNKLGGFTAKFLHGPQAAKSGVEAALLAQAGVTAFPEPFAGSDRLKQGFCYIGCDKPNLNYLTDGLGKTYSMPRLYFKPFSACRHTHGAIEVAIKAARENPVVPQDIESITIRTYHMAAISTGQNYTNLKSTFISCQFSIPYLVAAAIMDHKLGLEQLSKEKIANPAVHELAAKVKVVEDPEIEKVFPEKSPSVIEIRTKAGKVFTARTDAAKGDPQNPMSEQDFIEKFHSLTSQRMADKSRQAMVSMVLNLEKLDDLSKLMKLIS